MRAVILAGGKGTRLQPYTVVFPKPLMPLGDMPILEIVLRQLAAHGFTHVTMAVGYLAELIEAFVGDGSRFGMRIDYSREDEPQGTAGPLRMIEDLPDTFLVMNGDLLTTLNYSVLLEKHRQSGNVLTIATQQRQVQIDFGVLEADKKGYVRDYHEKPTLNHEVSIGSYAFSKEALKAIPPNGYFDFPQLILALKDRHAVGTMRHDGLWLDIGRHEDYEEAQTIFAKKRELFLPDEKR